ncbi:unnamed protein product, partial [Rotaria sp. Silwood1]
HWLLDEISQRTDENEARPNVDNNIGLGAAGGGGDFHWQ